MEYINNPLCAFMFSVASVLVAIILKGSGNVFGKKNGHVTQELFNAEINNIKDWLKRIDLTLKEKQ